MYAMPFNAMQPKMTCSSMIPHHHANTRLQDARLASSLVIFHDPTQHGQRLYAIMAWPRTAPARDSTEWEFSHGKVDGHESCPA